MSDELINGIYVSIKQEPTSKIVQGIKITNLETIYLKRVLSSCMFM